MPRRKNLYIVVHNPSVNTGTFEQVAEGVRRFAPHIRARVIRDKRARLRKWERIARPTLTVSMVELTRLRPLRGPVITGRKMSKLNELKRLADAGIPVPRWRLLEPDSKPDLSGFGPYVVVKPTEGGRGADIRIKRRGRVRYKPIEDELGPRVAQEFIYTGRWPVSYRVSVLFGRALFCVCSEGSHDRRPLEGPDRFGDQGGVSIVSTRKDCTYRLEADDEVIALARSTAAALPEIPLLGVDVVREQDTGRLFVLETNPPGYTWFFSSEAGRSVQADFDFSIDSQFGGLAVASRALAEETELRAR